MEKTFVMLKPGILQRRIVGEIITRLERKGLSIIALKMLHIDRETAETHYHEHKGKDFYKPLIEYMISSPCIAMVISGEHAVSKLRRLIGATKEEDALAGTIRGDYASETRMNVIHASDCPDSAEREIAIYFSPDEIFTYEDTNAKWLL